jgi:hypothetical protein
MQLPSLWPPRAPHPRLVGDARDSSPSSALRNALEEGKTVPDIPFTDVLNLRQAYAALRAFLQADYDRAPSEPVFDLLAMTDPFGRGTSDPAMWYDWLAAISSVMLPRTPEVEQLIQDTVSNDAYFVGTTGEGDRWYAQTLADGSQLWVYTYDGEVQAAGHHRVPHVFDESGGLVHPSNP